MHKFTNSVRTEFRLGGSAAVNFPREAAPKALPNARAAAHDMELGEMSLTARSCGDVYRVLKRTGF
ncbi:MAG: hypothetical protein DMG07_19075 [Acidobacteria bacterium]|nr:MAG: hypothetical protein DMG07_19075 [Acidobacteriota bacterium]